MLKPLDDAGREIDAKFSVEPSPGGARLVLESRGGGEGGPNPPRNREYAAAMELLFRRLGDRGAILTEVEILSRETQNLPIERRRIGAAGFAFPLRLAALPDLSELRRALGRASAAFSLRPDKKAGGNPTKRLRFTLDWPEAADKSAAELEALLAGRAQAHTAARALVYGPLGDLLRSSREPSVRMTLAEIARLIGRPLPREARTPQFWANAVDHHRSRRGQWLDAGFLARPEWQSDTIVFERRSTSTVYEPSTADPEELLRSATRARRTLRTTKTGKAAPPPGSASVEQAVQSVSRYVRDPNIVAWVLEEAAGTCEVCMVPAPFCDADGEPFLEVHHVRPLGEGGPDQTDNAVAACPNCHRRLHYGADRSELRASLIARSARLRDYPRKAEVDETASPVLVTEVAQARPFT